MLTRRAFMSRSKLVERPPEEDSRKRPIAESGRLTSLIVRRRGGRGAGGRSVAGAPVLALLPAEVSLRQVRPRNCNVMCSTCDRKPCDRKHPSAVSARPCFQ